MMVKAMMVDMDNDRFFVAGFARYGGAKKILSGLS